MFLCAPMVSVYVLVLGNKKLARPKSSAAAPMAHHRAGAFSGGRPPPVTSPNAPEPSRSRSTPWIKTYPFAVLLYKESLEVFVNCSAVLGVLCKFPFSKLESVFPAEFKCVFQKLQFCH